MLKTLKTFYGFLFKYKKRFFCFVFVLVVGVILGNLTPYIYKLLIDAVPSQNYDLLIKIVFLFIGVRIASNFLISTSYQLGNKPLFFADRDAKIAIFRRIQDLDFAFHVNKSTGALISVFKRGGHAFAGLFYDIHHGIFHTMIALCVILVFFGKIMPILIIFTLLVFFINIIAGYFLIRNNINKRKAFNKAEDRMSGIIVDNLINYETVKFFAQEQKEESRLQKESKNWISDRWAYSISFRLMTIVVGTISNLGILVIFYTAVRKLSMGDISIGDLMMVAAFTTTFYYQFFELLWRFRDMVKNFTDVEKYFAILDNEILIKDPIKPIKPKKIIGDIKFENIYFNYPENKQNVLKNINLHIKPDESIAFVGYSGVGKTTLIKLLMRFYDVTKGRILIDGINIKDFTKSQLRSFLGIVPQEPILFNNSIEFNIGYGKPGAKKQEIIQVSKIANLHKFINTLPKKYKTQVGERGIKLSGGQKQRLAIARMLLTDPEIIIFDEATSQLDSESERLIQNALWKIAKNRTVLIIAHRFSTVKRADRIIVLEKGKIVEQGSHEQLIKNNGIYNYLWGLQSKQEINS